MLHGQHNDDDDDDYHYDDKKQEILPHDNELSCTFFGSTKNYWSTGDNNRVCKDLQRLTMLFE